jgi:hypothetical protein
MYLVTLAFVLLLGGCSGVTLPGSAPPVPQERRTYCYQTTKDNAPPTVVPCPSASMPETGKAPSNGAPVGGL